MLGIALTFVDLPLTQQENKMFQTSFNQQPTCYLNHRIVHTMYYYKSIEYTLQEKAKHNFFYIRIRISIPTCNAKTSNHTPDIDFKVSTTLQMKIAINNNK